MSIPAHAAPNPPTPWYRVGEAWLIVGLLATAVFGSIGLVVTAIRVPDRHLVVPADVPRPSHLPPIHPVTHPVTTPATTTSDGHGAAR